MTTPPNRGGTSLASHTIWGRRSRRTGDVADCAAGLFPVFPEDRTTDAPPVADLPLDPVCGLRPAGRRGTRGRCRRRRLDPCRRDGRALRSEHLDRAGRGEGAAAAQPEGVRRPPDDRALRPLSRSLRQGRLRHHHGACGIFAAYPPLVAGDPRARQEGRRDAQSRHAGKHDRAGDRPRRPDPGDVGQSRASAARLSSRMRPRRFRGCARSRARGRSTSRSMAALRPTTRRRSRARARTCWSRAPRCSRAARPITTAPTSRRSAMPRRWRAGRLPDGRADRRQMDRRRTAAGDRHGRRVQARRQPLPRPHHGRRLVRLQGRGRALSSLRRARLPVGAPHADLSRAQGPHRRDLGGVFGAGAAHAGLDVRERPEIPRLHARHRQRLPLHARGLHGERAELHRQGHGADAVGQEDEADRQQRVARHHPHAQQRVRRHHRQQQRFLSEGAARARSTASTT